MLPIEPLELSAKQWQFLSKPDAYVAESTTSGRKLVLASTRRQFLTARDILARLNGSFGREPRRGVLLADDVGLGKTTVAALVAWVVASAGKKRGVRILAPNDVMVRRWEEELLSHVKPLQERAPALGVHENRVKAWRVGRLTAGSIQVVKHSYASSEERLNCDLLIIDEAHRAKGEGSKFSDALKKQRKFAGRVLILTATPFSIHIEELKRMLTLIGGEDAGGAVSTYSRALDDLYEGNTARSPDVVAERLAKKATAAVDALAACVIRHGIDDLRGENDAFGSHEDWNIPVPDARCDELELMLRMDRALRIAKDSDSDSSGATNDPRFHVGWRHFDAKRDELKGQAPMLPEPAKVVVDNHLRSIRQLRDDAGKAHTKTESVGAVVQSIVDQEEKVLLFCHHHATAQELTANLASVVPAAVAPRSLGLSAWRSAWGAALAPPGNERNEEKLRDTFIKWLCADLIRAQTWSWMKAKPASDSELLTSLKTTPARRILGADTIADAAQKLYTSLLQSNSSRAVLRVADEYGLAVLPGADGTSRVLGVCTASEHEKEKALFIDNQQPDTIISIFNSPFGPDVLVVTDKLSEGIDLHRYCRHLVHYELDPSPIRTVQRNGRLRRVNSWAAATGQPIRYAYPAFRGTRDHRLVQIMKKRIDSFSLLLGGVQDFKVEDVTGSDEQWRNEVIRLAKTQLVKTAGRLRAIDPEG